MSAASTPSTGQDSPPRPILLATDLSSRCDRAQDRAVRLAEQWNAKLFIVHVLPHTEPVEVPSWRRGHSEAAQSAERRIRADLKYYAGDYEIILAAGDPAESILHKAAERDCQLIVTGVARDEMMGRASLGQIVEQLVRESPIPVLVVKGRAYHPYGEILVATDYSASSRQAVACALHLFPNSPVTLFHAFQVPFEGSISRDANMDEQRRSAEAEQVEFMASLNHLPGVERIRPMLEFGQTEELVSRYVEDRDVRLLVLGTQGRSGVVSFLVGSTAKRLLASMPWDVLMVRHPG